MEQKVPNFLTQAAHFTFSYVKWVAMGKPLRALEYIQTLFNICENCPTKKFKRLGPDRGICTECGCRLKRSGTKFNKLAWPTESCPDGHWHADVIEPNE